jgi:hypothetical protein
MTDVPMLISCPACAAEALSIWWSAFDPRPSYPAYEDPSPRVLLADATHACPACDWHGAPAHGTDQVIESVADLLIVERVRTLAELSRILSTPMDMVFVSEKVATRNNRGDGVMVELADGRGASLLFPFVHWRLRRSVEYAVEWRDRE